MQQPKEVTDVLLAFPGSVVKEFMIPRDQIPDDYENKRFFSGLQVQWFYDGLKKDEIPPPREGIDTTTALRHLQAIQGSFEPKHEHKQECVAYFMSLWFQGPEAIDRKQGTNHTKPKPKPESKGKRKRRRGKK
jgi:hypothetical protein